MESGNIITCDRTLPSNLAVCVNPEMEYVKARDPASGRVYIVAETLLDRLPGAVPKAGKKGKAEQKSFEVNYNIIYIISIESFIVNHKFIIIASCIIIKTHLLED